MNLFSRFRPGFFLAALLIPMLFLVPEPAVAQSGRSDPPAKPAAPMAEPEGLPPRLRVAGAEKPIRLVSLAIHTEIQGGFAESSLDMVFHNPNGRVLEGELEFPLTPGQEISGLALDISGELRRGVPIAKARGQEVFDEVARHKVDPALLEATRGNAYRLRVYPLPANGERRVVVRIMQPLQAENGTLHYRLPLAFAEAIDSVSIEAEVVSPGGAVKAEAGNLGLRLEQAGTVYRGRAERKNISPEGWLDITLPAGNFLSASITAARWRDKLYFSTAALLTVPDQARNLPDRVTILWDASGSGRQRDQAKEFKLLDAYFKAFGSGEARLVVLRDRAEPPQTFRIWQGDWKALQAAIHGLVYDGATNLTDWAPAEDCREYLLFSDGLDNYRGASGKDGFPVLAPEQRLFAVNSAATADYAALRGLAAGGAVIDLAHEPSELAAAKLLREGPRVSVVKAPLADAAEAVLGPESAYLMSAEGEGGMIRLAGWAKRGGGTKEIPVRLVFPGGTTQEVAISMPAWEDAPEFTDEGAPLPARLWGRYAIAGLEADYRANKKAIARLGEELGIISRETSLIVLETAEDYARYGVTPPAALQAQVEALRRNKAAAGGEQRLPEDRLVSMWQEKVKWWETTFDQKPQSKQQETEPVERTEREESLPAARDRVIRRDLEVVEGDLFSSSRTPNSDAELMRSTYFDQAGLITSPGGDGGGAELPAPPPTPQEPNEAQRPAAASPAPPPAKLSVGTLNKAGSLLLNSEISAMESKSEARTISAPRIMAADGQTVSIKQGQQIPYKSGSSASDVRAESGADNSADPRQSHGGGLRYLSPMGPFRIEYGRASDSSGSSANADAAESGQASESDVGVRLKPWVSDAPYIARMKAAKDDDLYAIYLDERPDYLDSSAFFIDVADRFFERGLKDLGLRVLSNLAEMKLENRQILRMLAYRLVQAGEMAAALPVLEQVRELAPYEPQSLRDIATVQAALGQTQEAVDLLYEVARRQWSDRFGEINTIALTEMNAIIEACGREVMPEAADSRLIRNLASDIRVVLSWDMDNTDMDLWVTAPDGEAASYRHPRTRIGGRLSRDCTQGYGPEEFMLKKAIPGVYRVEVNYYGHSRQTIAGEVTMAVTVFSKFGTPQQKKETTTLRLKNTKDKVLVAEFTVEE